VQDSQGRSLAILHSLNSRDELRRSFFDRESLATASDHGVSSRLDMVNYEKNFNGGGMMS
jgi:hypothetical protein